MPDNGRPVSELDQEQIDAAERFMSDPLRRRILVVMADQPEFTINQLAERLEESPRRIRHAIETLIEARLVSPVGERSRRGAIVRAYSGVRLPLLWDGEWPRVDDTVRRQVILDSARALFGDVSRGLAGESFSAARDWQFVRFCRELDQQGFEELLDIHTRALEEIAAAYARTESRLAVGPGRTVPVMSGLLFFEVARRGEDDHDRAQGRGIVDELPGD